MYLSVKLHLCICNLFAEGRIYVVGGMGADTNPKDYFMGFDVENNRWQSLSPMPTPRYATFSFLIKDKLYVLGKHCPMQ